MIFKFTVGKGYFDFYDWIYQVLIICDLLDQGYVFCPFLIENCKRNFRRQKFQFPGLSTRKHKVQIIILFVSISSMFDNRKVFKKIRSRSAFFCLFWLQRAFFSTKKKWKLKNIFFLEMIFKIDYIQKWMDLISL